MNIDLNKVMLYKTDEELMELSTHYKKYTKEALIIFLNETKKRSLEIPNQVEIENRINEFEIEEERNNKVIEEKDLHPNIIRASKFILLNIPISIVQFIIAAYFVSQIQDKSFFQQVLSGFSAVLLLAWLITYLFSVWIKKGTSLARIVIGVLAGISIISQSFRLINVEYDGILLLLISVINVLIDVYIVYLLFNKESASWYKQHQL